jgi:hypothetical protein
LNSPAALRGGEETRYRRFAQATFRRIFSALQSPGKPGLLDEAKLPKQRLKSTRRTRSFRFVSAGPLFVAGG